MALVATGLREARGYLHRVRNKLPQVVKDAIGSPSALAVLRQQAHDDVDRVVYGVYEPAVYNRKDVIKDSVKAEVISDEPFEVAVFIPLDSETQATSGSSAGQVSYARFMLPGWAHVSFINGEAAKATLPRDFLLEWEKTFGESVPQRVLQAIDQELAK